jgi:hypothetical protein
LIFQRFTHTAASRGFLFAQIMPRCSHGVPLEHACHSCMQEGLARVYRDAGVKEPQEVKESPQEPAPDNSNTAA